MRQTVTMRLDATVLSSTTHRDHLLLVVSADDGPAMFIQIELSHLGAEDALPVPGDLVHVDGELTGGSMTLIPREFRISPIGIVLPESANTTSRQPENARLVPVPKEVVALQVEEVVAAATLESEVAAQKPGEAEEILAEASHTEVAPPDNRSSRGSRLFSWMPSDDVPEKSLEDEKPKADVYFRDSMKVFGHVGMIRGPFRLIPSDQDLMIPV